MGSNEVTMPALLTSPPPAGQNDGSASRSGQQAANRPQVTGKVQCRDRVISTDGIDCDPANITDIFKEDLIYRAQARRFLWEFFD